MQSSLHFSNILLLIFRLKEWHIKSLIVRVYCFFKSQTWPDKIVSRVDPGSTQISLKYTIYETLVLLKNHVTIFFYCMEWARNTSPCYEVALFILSLQGVGLLWNFICYGLVILLNCFLLCYLDVLHKNHFQHLVFVQTSLLLDIALMMRAFLWVVFLSLLRAFIPLAQKLFLTCLIKSLWEISLWHFWIEVSCHNIACQKIDTCTFYLRRNHH